MYRGGAKKFSALSSSPKSDKVLNAFFMEEVFLYWAEDFSALSCLLTLNAVGPKIQLKVLLSLNI